MDHKGGIELIILNKHCVRNVFEGRPSGGLKNDAECLYRGSNYEFNRLINVVPTRKLFQLP